MRVVGGLLGLVALLTSCSAPAPSSSTPPLLAEPADLQASEWFVDEASEAGLAFTHHNGMSGQYYMAEILAPGAALFDYDNDGDLDVYLVQGQALIDGTAAPQPADDRLFRNDLAVGADGTRRLRFADVTAASKLAPRGYGMGVAAADYDNDGDVDLYLTKFNAPNELWRNEGNGTFVERSIESGTNHRSWSTSASFVDIDRDGWLDLYVANYLRYALDASSRCFSSTGARDYCTPDSFPPLQDHLFRNRGDGTFDDVSVRSGIAREDGPGLGVSTADFNGDGWMDIYVANDGKENLLWLNRRDGSFQNAALAAGVALPLSGTAEASMGVDAGDFDDDGDDDLFMTELSGEGHNLFANDGTAVFDDRSVTSGVGASSLVFTGFGAAWLDVDNDGRLDLLAVNGTVQVLERLRQAGDPLPLHQPKTLFRNRGDGRFEDRSARAGRAFALSEVGRGLAVGDVDNDGRVDALVANNAGPVRLLMNRTPPRHWVGLRLRGVGGRDMLGARVDVSAAGQPTRWRRVRSDGSYLSANDPRVVVGTDDSVSTRTVRVRWPSGRSETFADVPVDRYTELVEGRGR